MIEESACSEVLFCTSRNPRATKPDFSVCGHADGLGRAWALTYSCAAFETSRRLRLGVPLLRLSDGPAFPHPAKGASRGVFSDEQRIVSYSAYHSAVLHIPASERVKSRDYFFVDGPSINCLKSSRPRKQSRSESFLIASTFLYPLAIACRRNSTACVA